MQDCGFRLYLKNGNNKPKVEACAFLEPLKKLILSCHACFCICSRQNSRWKEGNVLFNKALNIFFFYIGIYHGLYYTSCGALAGRRNSLLGPPSRFFNEFKTVSMIELETVVSMIELQTVVSMMELQRMVSMMSYKPWFQWLSYKPWFQWLSYKPWFQWLSYKLWFQWLSYKPWFQWLSYKEWFQWWSYKPWFQWVLKHSFNDELQTIVSMSYKP